MPDAQDETSLWWAVRQPWSLLALALLVATLLVYGLS
jgi:hypothetical protein